MRKAYKYRLNPTRKQEKVLFWTLSRCRELYNAALSERRDSYKATGRGVTYLEQKRDLPAIKAELREEYRQIHSQILQDVLLRLERAFKAFFRRLQNGEEPGYPRFQGRNRYTSFTYPQGGYTLSEKHVTFSKIGTIKCVFHRPKEGTIKTATIKYEAGQWYVVFSCEVGQDDPLPAVQSEVGIDLGITHFAALSDGSFIEPPRYLRRAQGALKRKQRHLSRCKRGSHRRAKAHKAVAQAHRKIAKQRWDFHHKQARKLVQAHQVLVFEDLPLANLVKRPKPRWDEETGAYLPNGANAKAGLNKSILDAGWGQFVQIVTHKAACAGRTIAKVNPNKTSQICSACGKQGPHKDLDERVHRCPVCGVVLDRDENAAINIYTAWKRPTYWTAMCGAASQCVEAPSR